MNQLKNLEPLNESTVSTRVLERLRSDILSHKIEANTRITVKSIAESYGVSAMPVREAFHVLVGERLLVMSPYKGATVLPLDKTYAMQVYDLQYALEGYLIEASMKNGFSEENIQALERINEEMRSNLEQEDNSRVNLNRSFHMTLYASCADTVTFDVFHQYFDLIGAIRTEYKIDADRERRTVMEHEEILKAIRAKDIGSAKKAVRRHIENSKKHFADQAIK